AYAYTIIWTTGSWLSFKSNSGGRMPSSGGTPASTGLCDKQGKKRSVPKPNYTFPRHVSRLHLNGGQAVSRTNKCHQNMHAPVPTGTVSLVSSAAIALPLGMLRMRPFQIWYLSMRLN